MKQQRLSHRLRTVAFIVVLTFCSMVAPAWSQSSSTDRQQGTPAGVGMQVASVASTILYFPCKAVYALGGGIVGGLAYLLSGGSEQTAKSIWIPSMYGTYFISPEHLTGERPVRFVGVAADDDGGTSAPASMDQSGSQPVQ
ncbi:MAG TPA: hypothetical protein VFX56_03105 [Nitrospira sp.]|nr:hypothetical protein [Nitrospira sp.]